PLGLDYISHAWAQAQQSNHKAQWNKTKPRPTRYGSEAARRTKGFQRTLPQGSESPLGKEQVLQDPSRPISDEALREYCDRNYHQILPIIAEKVHQEKVRRGLKERLGPRYVLSRSGSLKSRRDRSESPKKKGPERKAVFKRLEKVYSTGSETRGRVYPCTQTTQGIGHTIVTAVTLKITTKVLVQEQRNRLPRDVITRRRPREEWRSCQKVKVARDVIGSQNQKGKSRALRTIYPNHRVWFDDLPKESIDSYDDLKKAFLENYLQQKKCIKDPVEVHNIRQRDRESTEEFVRRYKLECRDVKGASDCMKISGFMHGITNPELIKRLHDKIPKLVDEMIRVTTTFLRGEAAASNRERKKSFPSWKQQEANQKQNFKKEASETNKGRKGSKISSHYSQKIPKKFLP
ncbi:reverse transcriptase domain-containing protein, partial [Tanacetum coccineum]